MQRRDERRRRLLILRQQASPAAAPDLAAADGEAAWFDEEDRSRILNFRDACAAKTPIRLAVADARGQECLRMEFERPFVLIGRDDDCDICLPHPEVSRCHAYLQVVAGRLFCCDLGSRTGTRWNATARPAGWLGRDDVLGIGPYTIHAVTAASFDRPAGDGVPLATESRQATAAGARAPVHLQFVRDGSSHPVQWRMDRDLALIGRSPRCKVQLRDKSVSRVHCSLVRTREGLWIVDLLGRGGTRVDGRPVRFTRLDEGREVTIGRFRARVVPPRPAEQPAGGEDDEPLPGDVPPGDSDACVGSMERSG